MMGRNRTYQMNPRETVSRHKYQLGILERAKKTNLAENMMKFGEDRRGIDRPTETSPESQTMTICGETQGRSISLRIRTSVSRECGLGGDILTVISMSTKDHRGTIEIWVSPLESYQRAAATIPVRRLLPPGYQEKSAT